MTGPDHSIVEQHGGRVSLGDCGPTDEKPPFRFSMRTVVDLHATDAMGVVYFGRWSRYVERAVSEYRIRLGDDPAGVSGHWFMIRSFALDYHGPGRAGDAVEIFLRCSSIGRTSHTFEAQVVLGGTNDVLVEIQLVVVGIDGFGPNAAATPMPEEMRNRIAAFEGLE